jgi:hypothetical protein
MTLDDFTREAQALGYQETLSRSWDPLTVLATHSHPFDARAVVTQGEMWLTVAGNTQHLQAGDRFEVAHDVPHEERYGPQGATYWVARRS